MRPVQPPRNALGITVQRIFQKFIRFLQNAHDLRPAAHAHGVLELSGNLPVRDKGFLANIITCFSLFRSRNAFRSR